MNWKKALFKPDWRSKDPEVRRQAVASGRDPELIAALETIAREDEEAGVRSAAIRRLSDPGLLFDLLGTEQDGAARKALSARLRTLLTSPLAETVKSSDLTRILTQTQDRELLEAVAEGAPDAAVRKTAIGRIERQGFLGDRAIHDADAEVRRAAAGAIHQHSTLARVIEAARTADKALHQELTERLHRERLEAGDAEAIAAEALSICESLERLALEGVKPGDPALEELTGRWAALSATVPPALARRFGRDLERVRLGDAAPRPREQPPVPAMTEPTTDESTDAVPDVPDAVPDVPDAVPDVADAGLVEAMDKIRAAAREKRAPGPKRIAALERSWSQAWSRVPAPNPADDALGTEALRGLQALHQAAEDERRQRDQWIEEAGTTSELMEQALADGELHKALEARVRLQQVGQKLGGGRRWKQLQGQLNSTLGRLRELRDWQHWANDKIRKRLIDEMEALPGTGLHPDAVLDRIKSLQAEWKDLERSEQIPGDRHYAAAPWMWRRFQAAGRKAFEAAKPFLEKRSEVQEQRVAALRDAAERLTALASADETADPVQLRRATAEVRKGLNQLSSLPHKARKSLARKLKKALASANEVMKAHYEQIEKQKLKLIREAAQLQHMADRDAAVAEAKRLQAAWKAAGSLWRKRENELWDQFREPIDPLFEALDEERSADRERHAEQLAAQQDLCERLGAIVALPGDELAEQQGPVQGLIDGWDEFHRPDRRLRARFDELLNQFRKRQREQRQLAAQQRREARRRMADLVHRAEQACTEGKPGAADLEKLRAEWPAGEEAPGELEVALAQRFARALDGQPEDDASAAPERVAAAQKICILLEFIAGLPTPKEEQELRMKYQVERLSASMSGERQRVSAIEEMRRLEADWLALGYLPEPAYRGFQKRIERAVEEIISQG